MQKFIIKKDGTLVMGNVGYHFELFSNTQERCRGCYGGGMYDIDEEKKHIHFYGSSSDFGYPDFDKLKELPEEYVDGGYTFDYNGAEISPFVETDEKPIIIYPHESRQVRRAKERALAKKNKRKNRK